MVHISSGISGLMVAYLLGHRKGFGDEAILPHQIPMTILGAGLLWFGWFGFNAGSALTANGLAASALLTTNSSAAAAGLSWLPRNGGITANQLRSEQRPGPSPA